MPHSSTLSPLSELYGNTMKDTGRGCDTLNQLTGGLVPLVGVFGQGPEQHGLEARVKVRVDLSRWRNRLMDVSQ